MRHTTDTPYLFSNSFGSNDLSFSNNNFVNAIGFNFVPLFSIFDENSVHFIYKFYFIIEEINGAITSLSSGASQVCKKARGRGVYSRFFIANNGGLVHAGAS